MLSITTVVAIFKREKPITTTATTTNDTNLAFGFETLLKKKKEQQSDDDDELDASEIGLKETYRRLWAVCKLPSVQWLFLILFSYRFPVSLSDNVKFLKAVEYGMSKSITALLSPTLILPIGILVPIVAAKIWHGHPLRQFMQAYKLRVTLVPLFDILMLFVVKNSKQVSTSFFWLAIIASTGLQAICNSLQFNSQMMFFASRVDPAIGGTYMTLLNTAANMGGTWPSSFVMYLMGAFSSPADCAMNSEGIETCVGGRDAYVPLQIAMSVIGLAWIAMLGGKVKTISELPDEAWRTNLLDQDLASVVVVPDVESNNSNSKTKDCSKRE